MTHEGVVRATVQMIDARLCPPSQSRKVLWVHTKSLAAWH